MKTMLLLLLSASLAAAQTPTLVGLVTTNLNYTNKLWASAANAQTNTPNSHIILDVSLVRSAGLWAGGRGDTWNSTGTVTLAFSASPNSTNFGPAKFWLTYTQNGTNFSFGSTNWTLGNDDAYIFPIHSTNASAGNVTGFLVRPVYKSYPRN